MRRIGRSWWGAALLLTAAAPGAGGEARAQVHASRPWASNVIVPQARAFGLGRAPAVQVAGVSVGVVIRDQAATTLMEIRLSNPGGSRQEAELLVPVGKITSLHLDLRAPLEVAVRGRRHAVTRVVLAADEPRVLAALVRERAGLSSPRPGHRP